MKKGVCLSFVILVLVVGSTFLLDVYGVSRDLWSRTAFVGNKKVSSKNLVKVVYQTDLSDLSPEKFHFLERYPEPVDLTEPLSA